MSLFAVLDGERATPACAGVDPDVFFPEPPGAGLAPDTGRARAICATCPVRVPCLEYALQHSLYGVWGGTTEKQRAKLRARRGLPSLPNPARAGLGGAA